jgi:hypothetical protein
MAARIYSEFKERKLPSQGARKPKPKTGSSPSPKHKSSYGFQYLCEFNTGHFKGFKP